MELSIKPWNTLRLSAIVSVFSLILVACGGGGSGDSNGADNNNSSGDVVNSGNDNTELSRLVIEGIKEFDSDELNGAETETISVENEVNQIFIAALPDDNSASVSINGGPSSRFMELDEGDNPIQIIITASDGATVRSLNINVHRQVSLSNAHLKGLTTSAGVLLPSFSRDQNQYIISVESTVSNVVVTPYPVSDRAEVSVNGEIASTPINLPFGQTSVEVQVISEDKTVTNTYILQFNRSIPAENEEQNANLSVLLVQPENGVSGVDPLEVNPVFSPETSSYEVVVPHEVGSINLNLITENILSSVNANNESGIGELSTTVNFNSGGSTNNFITVPVDIVVTAPDGNVKKNYVVNLIRLPSLALSGLSLSYSLMLNNGSSTTVNLPIGDFNASSQLYSVPFDAVALTVLYNTVNSNNDVDTKLSANGQLTSGPTVNLNVGENELVIGVTADGYSSLDTCDHIAIECYTLNINRSVPRLELSYLAINSLPNSAVDFNYEFDLSGEEDNFNIGVPFDVSAFEFNTDVVTSGTEVVLQAFVNNTWLARDLEQPISFGEADSILLRLLTNHPDSAQEKIYELQINRVSNTKLSNVSLSGISSGWFDPNIDSYRLDVGYLKSQVDLSLRLVNEASSVEIVNPVAVAMQINSGDRPFTIPLSAPGTTTLLTLRVTASDGVIYQDYNIELVRPEMNELSQLLFKKNDVIEANQFFGDKVVAGGNNIAVLSANSLQIYNYDKSSGQIVKDGGSIPLYPDSEGKSTVMSIDISDNMLAIGENVGDNGQVRVYVKKLGAWRSQRILESPKKSIFGGKNPYLFGRSVAVDEDVVIVGSPRFDPDYLECDTKTGYEQIKCGHNGIVYAYYYDRFKDVWINEPEKIFPPSLDEGDLFGWTVDIDNGDIAISSAGFDTTPNSTPGSDSDYYGAVYLFSAKNLRRNGGTLSDYDAIVRAPVEGETEWFGNIISISNGVLAVTANVPRYYDKRLYVFEKGNNGLWNTESTQLIQTTLTHSESGFANSISVSGSLIAAGSPAEASPHIGINAISEDQCYPFLLVNLDGTGNIPSGCTPQSGSIFLFSKESGVWMERAFIKPSNTSIDSWFGGSIVLNDDYLVVGASGESNENDASSILSSDCYESTAPTNCIKDSGAIYIFGNPQ